MTLALAPIFYPFDCPQVRDYFFKLIFKIDTKTRPTLAPGLLNCFHFQTD